MVVLVRTMLLYIVVVAVMRVMGKRQIGELQPFELVIAIMLSELAAVPMQDTGIPLIHGLIPIFTLMVLQIFISFLTLKFEFMRKLVCGLPSILIKKGEIVEEELARQRFNLDDLMEELRMLGYLNVSDVEYAILETSGKVSIIPKHNKTPVTKEDLSISPTKTQLPIGLVLDGKINRRNLELTGHDEKWLMDQLLKYDISQAKDAFYAMIDSSGKFFVQRRE